MLTFRIVNLTLFYVCSQSKQRVLSTVNMFIFKYFNPYLNDVAFSIPYYFCKT